MSFSEVSIRSASVSDCDAVYDFICDLEEEALDKIAFRQVFSKNVNNPEIRYFISEQDGKITGFISLHIQLLLHHTAPIGEIQELYVSPVERGKGTGRKLVEAAFSAAEKEGCAQVEVCCNQKRKQTHEFYKQMGFSCTHFKFCRK